MVGEGNAAPGESVADGQVDAGTGVAVENGRSVAGGTRTTGVPMQAMATRAANMPAQTLFHGGHYIPGVVLE